MADVEVKAKHAGGRPLKYKSVEEMQAIIDKYFDDMEELGRPLTITGLAFALEIDREQLINYTNKDKFADTLKRARQRIYVYAEESLWTSRNPAGPIFNLKNNYGWKDKQEVDLNVNSGYAERLQAAEQRNNLINVTPDDVPKLEQ